MHFYRLIDIATFDTLFARSPQTQDPEIVFNYCNQPDWVVLILRIAIINWLDSYQLQVTAKTSILDVNQGTTISKVRIAGLISISLFLLPNHHYYVVKILPFL